MSARLAVAITVLLVSVGCAADPEPEPIFAEPEPSAVPAAAPEKERETVKQFLRRWADVDAAMQNTGNVDDYLELSPGCEPCEALAQLVRETYAAGGYMRTDPMTIERVRRIGDSDKYRVSGALSPAVFRPSREDGEENHPGGPFLYGVVVERSGETFVVTGMVRIAR